MGEVILTQKNQHITNPTKPIVQQINKSYQLFPRSLHLSNKPQFVFMQAVKIKYN